MAKDLILNVGVLFIMMLPGLIMKKCSLSKDGFGKSLSSLVLYIAQPALIVYAYISCESSFADIWQNALWVLALSVVSHVIFTVAATLLFRGAEESKAKMLKFATVFSNAAFMGIPLVKLILGAEAAIYASVYNITFNAFLWTLGVHFCTRKEGEDVDKDGDVDAVDVLKSAKQNIKSSGSVKRLLLHPVTTASVVGVILLASGINLEVLAAARLGFISDSIRMLSELVAPLSMTVIGLRLADLDLRGFFRDGYMYIFLALRHLALPLAVIGVIKLLGAAGIELSEAVSQVTVIMASAPAATSATMFAEMYDCDANYVSRLVIVSTILCILTMPLCILLI